MLGTNCAGKWRGGNVHVLLIVLYSLLRILYVPQIWISWGKKWLSLDSIMTAFYRKDVEPPSCWLRKGMTLTCLDVDGLERLKYIFLLGRWNVLMTEEKMCLLITYRFWVILKKSTPVFSYCLYSPSIWNSLFQLLSPPQILSLFWLVSSHTSEPALLRHIQLSWGCTVNKGPKTNLSG